MRIKVFRLRTEEEERFAVAVPTDGPLIIIQTYHNMEQLETGYRHWHEYASKSGITKPVPIERLRDGSGKWKILEGLLPEN